MGRSLAGKKRKGTGKKGGNLDGAPTGREFKQGRGTPPMCMKQPLREGIEGGSSEAASENLLSNTRSPNQKREKSGEREYNTGGERTGQKTPGEKRTSGGLSRGSTRIAKKRTPELWRETLLSTKPPKKTLQRKTFNRVQIQEEQGLVLKENASRTALGRTCRRWPKRGKPVHGGVTDNRDGRVGKTKSWGKVVVQPKQGHGGNVTKEVQYSEQKRSTAREEGFFHPAGRFRDKKE